VANAATQFFRMTPYFSQKISGFSEVDLEGKYFVANVSVLYEISRSYRRYNSDSDLMGYDTAQYRTRLPQTDSNPLPPQSENRKHY
jgi:hypothetical protein